MIFTPLVEKISSNRFFNGLNSNAYLHHQLSCEGAGVRAVIPAQAGIQGLFGWLRSLDPGTSGSRAASPNLPLPVAAATPAGGPTACGEVKNGNDFAGKIDFGSLDASYHALGISLDRH
jgi:hypothetical protein